MVLTNINLAKLYSDDTKKILEKLENIEKATLRAKDLSNQLFTFSRGGAPLKKKIPINQLIVENIEFALSGAHILPRFYIAEDLQMVEADKSQLSQVLNNIAINAVQAMPDGASLEVRAENVFLSAADSNYFIPLPDGPYIKITIKDEGTGIPAEYLSKIFDPFSRPKTMAGAWAWQSHIPLSKNTAVTCMWNLKYIKELAFIFSFPQLPRLKQIPPRGMMFSRVQGKYWSWMMRRTFSM